MTEPYDINEKKKIARALVRLRHSIEADREIRVLLEQMQSIGTEGITPQIETTLSEILGNNS